MGTTNSDTEEKTQVSAGQVRNANSRMIFGNTRLASQFLRNYTDLPLFSDVKPEDIEDVTERYQAYLGIEFEPDTIMKVRVSIDGMKQEVFVLPLVEHKSYVDYDVSMQIFRYMAVIWYDYAKEQNKLHPNISHTKSFRYPLIIPIVYYEGADNWTADRHLKSRIANAQMINEYSPDFTYCLVNCRSYTKEELESRHDEMSLVMLINRIQKPEDYSDFFNSSKNYALSVYGNAPKDIKQIFSNMIWSLLMNMNVPVNEAQEAITQLEVSGMGYLFENAEKMDIQAERQKTKEAEKKAQEAVIAAKKAEEEAQQTLQVKDHILDLMLKDLLQQAQSFGHTKEEMLNLLQKNYDITEADALEKIKRYWK